MNLHFTPTAVTTSRQAPHRKVTGPLNPTLPFPFHPSTLPDPEAHKVSKTKVIAVYAQ